MGPQTRKNGLKSFLVKVPWFGRLFLQVLLFLIFLQYFGLPSWRRYQEGQVVVVSHEREDGFVPAPAVTFCPQNPNSFGGFKNATLSDGTNSMAEVCEGKEDMKKCIEEAAYNLTEAIKRYGFGPLMNMDKAPEESAWSTYFGLAHYGLCYTLNSSFNMTIYNTNGTINIGLQNLSYMMVVHDPNIFIHSANPSIPQQWSIIKYDNQLTLQNLLAVERRNMV